MNNKPTAAKSESLVKIFNTAIRPKLTADDKVLSKAKNAIRYSQQRLTTRLFLSLLRLENLTSVDPTLLAVSRLKLSAITHAFGSASQKLVSELNAEVKTQFMAEEIDGYDFETITDICQQAFCQSTKLMAAYDTFLDSLQELTDEVMVERAKVRWLTHLLK